VHIRQAQVNGLPLGRLPREPDLDGDLGRILRNLAVLVDCVDETRTMHKHMVRREIHTSADCRCILQRNAQGPQHVNALVVGQAQAEVNGPGLFRAGLQKMHDSTQEIMASSLSSAPSST
jgi:hypothetical protein